jgi:hypothetical protein
MGPRAAAAALVEQQDVIALGIEQPAMVGAAGGAGAAVEEDDGLALRVAAQLPINLMAVAGVEPSGAVGLDGGVEGTQGQKLCSS